MYTHSQIHVQLNFVSRAICWHESALNCFGNITKNLSTLNLCFSDLAVDSSANSKLPSTLQLSCKFLVSGSVHLSMIGTIFNAVLIILCPSYSHIDFWINLSFLFSRLLKFWLVLHSIYIFTWGKIDTLTILSVPIHRHNVFQQLFR